MGIRSFQLKPLASGGAGGPSSGGTDGRAGRWLASSIGRTGAPCPRGRTWSRDPLPRGRSTGDCGGRSEGLLVLISSSASALTPRSRSHSRKGRASTSSRPSTAIYRTSLTPPSGLTLTTVGHPTGAPPRGGEEAPMRTLPVDSNGCARPQESGGTTRPGTSMAPSPRGTSGMHTTFLTAPSAFRRQAMGTLGLGSHADTGCTPRVGTSTRSTPCRGGRAPVRHVGSGWCPGRPSAAPLAPSTALSRRARCSGPPRTDPRQAYGGADGPRRRGGCLGGLWTARGAGC